MLVETWKDATCKGREACTVQELSIEQCEKCHCDQCVRTGQKYAFGSLRVGDESNDD